MSKPSSLYIHIPFCKKLCGYCDFYKTMSLAKLPQVLVRTAEEMRERAPMLAGTTLKTIYFGGGTPTVCAPEELGALIALAGEIFGTSEVEEVTVEANPDDLTDEYLAGLRKVGVNRLSIGIQSFRDEDLRMMNRRHTAEEAVRAVERARKAGFDNISIDLIYGLPTATLEDWLKLLPHTRTQLIPAPSTNNPSTPAAMEAIVPGCSACLSKRINCSILLSSFGIYLLRIRSISSC